MEDPLAVMDLEGVPLRVGVTGGVREGEPVPVRVGVGDVDGVELPVEVVEGTALGVALSVEEALVVWVFVGDADCVEVVDDDGVTDGVPLGDGVEEVLEVVV